MTGAPNDPANRRGAMRQALGVAIALAGCLPPARAQPAKPARVAFISPTLPTAPDTRARFDAFRAGLAAAGFSERTNLLLEPRWYGADTTLLASQVAELLTWKPDVILAATTPTATAVQRAANGRVPIVFAAVSDPVGSGLVASLSRPGGNVTGLTDLGLESAGKLAEFASMALPGLRRLAVFISDNAAHAAQLSALREVADRVGLQVVPVPLRSTGEVDRVFASLDQGGLRAVVVLGGPPQNALRDRMAELGLRHNVAVLTPLRPYVVAGALLSYGPASPVQYRQAGEYVARILRGARPAELPVQHPTELELVLNQQTARALKLQLPQALLLQASEVID